ncbi:transketolase, partial [Tsukamurella conjunctivitidis]
GKGSPNKEGSEATHGAPLGADEIAATKASLGWNYGPFEVPEEIYQAWDARTAGDQREEEWNSRFDAYVADHPEKADELLRRIAGELPDNFEEIFAAALKSVNEKEENIATRVASKNALDLLATNLAEIVGGSADLTPSNNTFFKGSRDLDITTGEGNYIRFGVREFGMAAIMNGLALYGGFIPYGA